VVYTIEINALAALADNGDYFRWWGFFGSV